MRLIDADELMEHVWRDKLDSRELIAEMIDNAPTVKEIPTKIPINIFEQLISQQSKTGKWIDEADKIDAQFGKHTYKCSKCGKYAEYFISGTEVWWDRIKPNYCPNCGAKMEVKE